MSGEENSDVAMTKAKALLGARILVAEDEPWLAFDMITVLMHAGGEVVGPAMCLERALELARREQFHCGVLDVRLRGGPVWPVAQLLTQKGAGILLYSAEDGIDGLARAWPGAAVLSKPAPPRLLIQAAVRVCCGASSAA